MKPLSLSSLSNLHTFTFLTFNNKPQGRTHSNFLHFLKSYSLFIHYLIHLSLPSPSKPVNWIPPVFATFINVAPLPQYAKLQVRVILKVFFFFILGYLDTSKVWFHFRVLSPGLSIIFSGNHCSHWELYQKLLESFWILAWAILPFQPPLIQAHTHSLPCGLWKSMGRKNSFLNLPRLPYYAIHKASICPKDKNVVLVYEKNIYP